MKKLLALGFMSMFAITVSAQDGTKIEKKMVKASCGQCQFGLKSTAGCDLAVKIDDKAYFVEGSSMADHGDAHAKDGMCNAVRDAEVTGEVVDGKFNVSDFKLVEAAGHDHKEGDGHKH
jgi:hypothetical protein